MKSDAERTNKAATEIAGAIERHVRGLAPKIQRKHGLTRYMLNLAITKAAGLTAAKFAEASGTVMDSEQARVAEKHILETEK